MGIQNNLPSMPHLHLTCFKNFNVALDGHPSNAFYSTKTQALLVYLAVEQGVPHSRSALSGLLWPDYSDKRARRNLSQTLTALRKDIGDQQGEDSFFEIATQSIAFKAPSPHTIDVRHFCQLLADVPTLTQLQQAADLYKGPFLADFPVIDSDLFENWVLATREKLQQRAIDGLTQLSRSYAAQGKLPHALITARRLLTLTPWQEEAHRQLMLLLAYNGQRTAALTQYDTCAQMLMNELGVSPSTETNALYDQILAGDLPTTAWSSNGVATGAVAESVTGTVALSSAKPVPFQALSPPAHFVGRGAEIEIVSTSVLFGQEDNQGATRIALVGMGGVGKTTLAAGVATALRATFADGVLWANSATSHPHNILELWGRAYGFDLGGLADLESRATAVRSMLADKQALIVLDNVDDAALVRPLLPNGQRCAVLITTRSQEVAAALNARIYGIGELAAESGVQLLKQILGDRRIEEEEAAAAEICALLHCLPLAVEIAAQRLKSRPRMKLAAMAERLYTAKQRLDLSIGDQAVRTSFAVSWDGLTDELQHIFALQALFVGRPFSAEAIAHITELDPFDAEDQLDALMALSLLNEEGEAHYCQHPLLADFACEKLASGAKAARELFDQRLVDYYLAFARQNNQTYVALEPEWANITAAIEMAFGLEQWTQVMAFTDLLAQAWRTRSRYDEARQAYALARKAAQRVEDEEAEAQILLRWGEVCAEQNAYVEADRLLDESLAIYYRLEDGGGIADAQFESARVAIERSQHEQATELLSSCLLIRHALDDNEGAAAVMYQLAWVSFSYDELEVADEFLQRALVIYESTQNMQWLMPTLRFLAQVAAKQKEYALAHEYCQRAYQFVQEVQDESELATLFYTWAIVLRRQGRFDEAIDYGERALSLFRRLGLQRLQGMVLYQLGVIFQETDDLNQAQLYLVESIEICKVVQNSTGQLYSTIALGDIFHLLGHASRSRLAWQDAQAIACLLDDVEVLEELEEKLQEG